MRRDYGKFIVSISLVFAIICLVFSIYSSFTFESRTKETSLSNEPFEPGRYLISFEEKTSQKRSEGWIKSAKAADLVKSEGKDWISVKVNSLEELKAIQKLESVKAVRPEPKRFKMDPNDSYYNSQNSVQAGRFDQWNLRQIGFKPTSDLTSAWNVTTGSSSTTIATIDTGVSLTNPDITGANQALWVNQQEIPAGIFNTIDTNSNGIILPSELLAYFELDPDGAGPFTKRDLNGDSVINFIDIITASNGSLTNTLLDGVDNNTPPNSFVDDIFKQSINISSLPASIYQTNTSISNIWINQAEIPGGLYSTLDTNSNSYVDSAEIITYFRNNNLDINLDGFIDLSDTVSSGSPLRNSSPLGGYVDDIYGYNFTDGNPNLNDIDGHGTHVFGVIGAITNNNSAINPGIAGICWTCKVMPLKVINDFGFGYDSDIADAIDYAVANGAKIINMSLGGPGYSQVLEDAITNAWDNGVLVIAASGNYGSSASDSYPGGSHRVISVGATNYLDQVPTFSNTGEKLDIVAPGENVLSTYLPELAGCVGAGQYNCLSGTSMATPHISGVAALLYDLHKNDTTPWDAKQIRAALLKNTSDLSIVGFDNSTGFGRVEALNVLNSVELATDSTPPTASLSPFSNQLVKGNINVTGNVNDDNLYIYNISFVRVSDSYTVKQVAGRNNVSSDTLSIVNTLTLPDDIYNVTMRAEDFWGNEITSNTIQITIDNTAPSSFALNTPTNLSYTTNPRPAFTWDASSDIHGITYDIIANSGSIATNLSGTNFTPSSDLPEATYTWNVNAKDTAGNIRSSASYSFTTDRTAPADFSINISINNLAPTFTFAANDAVAGIDNYQISINGGSFTTISSPFSPGNQAVGNYSVTIRATDKAGNSKDSTANYTISDICGPRKAKADFNCDGVVNLSDLSILAANWLKTTPASDTNGDGIVNLSDLSILAANWLKNV